MLKALVGWRDDRVALAHAKEDLAQIWLTFSEKQNAYREGTLDGANWQGYRAHFFEDVKLADANIAQIETRQHVALAKRWEVPIPARPDPLSDDENEWWSFHRPHEAHYLSDVGKAHIRREAYLEMDMRSRPLLSWAAFGVSIASLLVAGAALLRS